MKCRMFVLLVLGALIAFPAMAKKEKLPDAVKADTSEKFTVLVETIRSQMAPGKRYEFLKDADRQIVNAQLDSMAAMLAKSGSVAAMTQEEKVELFNLQEKVNTTLAKNADNRQICTHERPVGSHLPVTKCMTAREAHVKRENARHDLDRYQRLNIAPGRQ